MMEGMVTALLSSMGIDPKQLLTQAAAIGERFGLLEQLLREIKTDQRAIMAHLGIEVPPMSPEEEAIAAAGTAAHIAALAIKGENTARGLLGAS